MDDFVLLFAAGCFNIRVTNSHHCEFLVLLFIAGALLILNVATVSCWWPARFSSGKAMNGADHCEKGFHMICMIVLVVAASWGPVVNVVRASWWPNFHLAKR